MGREDDCRFFATNPAHHLINRRWRKGRLWAIAHLARLQDGDVIRESTRLKNLRPAITEPAIAQNQAFLILRKLARYRLHAIGTATGNHNGAVCGINLFEHGRDIGDDLLELGRHVIERAVGIHHRKLEQSIGVHCGQ